MSIVNPKPFLNDLTGKDVIVTYNCLAEGTSKLLMLIPFSSTTAEEDAAIAEGDAEADAEWYSRAEVQESAAELLASFEARAGFSTQGAPPPSVLEIITRQGLVPAAVRFKARVR